MAVSDRPPLAALDDARATAASLLWPVDVGRWTRLVVLAFLVGGFGGTAGAGGNLQGAVAAPGGTAGATPELPRVDITPDALPSAETVANAVGLVVAVGITLLVLYMLAGAIAEFVLVVGIRDREVGIRRAVRRHGWRGVRLFLFRVGVWTVALVVGLIPAAIAVALAVTVNPWIGVLAVPALLVLVLTLAPAWLVLQLTTDLVVPTMVATGASGPADGWGRFRSVVGDAPLDVGLYLLAKFVIGAAAEVAVGLVAGLLAIVLAVPFAIVGSGLLAGAGETLSWETFAVLLGLAVLYSALTLVLVVVVRTPVVVYFRSYAMATLGRIDPDLDLLGVAADGDGEGGSAGDTGQSA